MLRLLFAWGAVLLLLLSTETSQAQTQNDDPLPFEPAPPAGQQPDSVGRYMQPVTGEDVLLPGSTPLDQMPDLPVLVQPIGYDTEQLGTPSQTVERVQWERRTVEPHEVSEELKVTTGSTGGRAKAAGPLDGPVGTPDNFVALANQTLSIAAPGFLGNDIDLDGGAVFGQTLADDVDHGSLSALTSGSFNYTPDPGFLGTDSFAYTGVDDDGNSYGPVTVTILVVEGNRDPVGTDDSYGALSGMTLVIAAPGFLTNDIDPDGDMIFGQTLADDVDNGVLSATTSGSFTYTPVTGFTGTDSFAYTGVDTEGNPYGPITVTIEVIEGNRPPSGTDDVFAAIENTPLAVTAPGFLANDLDPDGDVVFGQTLADDVDHGSLSATTSGSFNYTPDAGFTGTDSFVYTGVDSEGNNYGPITVTIVVSPSGTDPVGIADMYKAPAGGTLAIAAPGFLANDLDLDGGTVFGQTLADDVDHGSLSATTSGSFSYTPDPGFVGTDSFTYTGVDDEGIPYGPVTVTIEVIEGNRAPSGTDDAYGALAGMTLVMAAPGFLANDIDPDGDMIFGQTLADDVDHGSLSATTSGSFNYTPDPGFTGTDSFAYTGVDTEGNTYGPVTVTIEVIEGNRSPIGVDDQYAALLNTSLVILSPGFLTNDIDPDGDMIFGQTLADDVDHGSLSATTSGSFTYTPVTGFTGSDSFAYTGVDSEGNTYGPVTVEIRVLSEVPQACDPADDPYWDGTVVDVGGAKYLPLLAPRGWNTIEFYSTGNLSVDGIYSADATTDLGPEFTRTGDKFVYSGAGGPYTEVLVQVSPVGAGSSQFFLKLTDLGFFCPTIDVDPVVALHDEGEDEQPVTFALEQNYPNPFNPTTTIAYSLPESADVTLTLIDMLGRTVRRVSEGTRPAGQYRITLDASTLSSGVYLYRLQAGNHVATRLLTVIK